jgi:hypothetical protein
LRKSGMWPHFHYLVSLLPVLGHTLVIAFGVWRGYQVFWDSKIDRCHL